MIKHNTKIEWTHIPGYTGETWNPVVGCDIVSKGCTNCYAMKWAAQRLDGNKNASHYYGTTRIVNGNPVWTGKVATASEKTLLKPLHWKKPRSIFVNSMGDLFHESVPDEWIDKVFAVMALCPQHIFMILTKRPDRMREYNNQSLLFERIGRKASNLTDKNIKTWDLCAGRMIPSLPNVWLGTSVEDQATANERIPHLLSTPAAVRFLSCEPLLGAVDLGHLQPGDLSVEINALAGSHGVIRPHIGKNDKLNWVIAGGESGQGARPMHPDWVRGLRDQCAEAGVPFFFKQWGEFVTGYFDGDEYEVDEDCHGPCEGRGVTPCHTNYDMDPLHYIRVGKSRGGHMLDGKTHYAWPNCVTQQASEGNFHNEITELEAVANSCKEGE